MQHWDADIQRRTSTYANDILDIIDHLPHTRSANIIANQVGRSATSVMANHAESTRPKSVADKISKQGTCLQELQESRAWLALLEQRGYIHADAAQKLIEETDELISLFVSSIKRLGNH
ncbi:MAG: four helix bundle protein [Roseiflexaceae bacterium]